MKASLWIYVRYKKLFYLNVKLLSVNFILMVDAHESVVRTRQLASVAQLVRALHRNRRATGSIPVRGPIVAFFTAAPS